MPWTAKDCKSHNSKCDGKCCEKWAATANSVRAKAIKDGKSEKEADAEAMRIANGSVNESLDNPNDSTDTTFQESFTSGTKPLVVDREKCIVYSVKILGPKSKNTGNRANDYPVETQKKAVPLLEGAQVNFDHADEGVHCRSYRDSNGTVQNVRQEGDSTWADHHYNPHKPLTEAYLWDAEHSPQSVCFSIRGGGKRYFNKETGRYVVSEIQGIQSVDLVSKGGTTIALNESLEPEVPVDQKDFCEHGLSACSDARTIILESTLPVSDKKTKLRTLISTWRAELCEGEIADKLADRERSEKLRKLNYTADDLISCAIYDDETYPTVENKKERILQVLADWSGEIAKLPSAGGTTTKESLMAIDYKEVTLAGLRESRQDLVDVLTGNDSQSKLAKEIASLKESIASSEAAIKAKDAEHAAALATAKTEAAKLQEQLDAIKAKEAKAAADAALATTIQEEIKAAKLPNDPVILNEAFMESLRIAPDATARKRFIDAQVALVKKLNNGQVPDSPPFASATTIKEDKETGSRKPIKERLR